MPIWHRRSKVIVMSVALLLVAGIGAGLLFAQKRAEPDQSRSATQTRSTAQTAADNTGKTPPLNGDMSKFQLADAAAAVPSIGFADTTGHRQTLNSFKGKTLLLNFWATWCAPCVEEMGSLVKLKHAYQSPQFAVINIAEDHAEPKAIDKFMEGHEAATLDRYRDPDSELGSALGVQNLPTTFLISADGHIIGKFEGKADWNGSAARALIDWALSQHHA